MLLKLPGLSSLKITPKQQVNIQRVLNDLVVGQILQANVVKITTDKQLTLTIEGQKVKTQTSHPFQAGDKLLLKVKSNGTIPELEVIGKEIEHNKIQQAIRQALPNQIPPKQLLNTLQLISHQAQVSQSSIATTNTQPHALTASTTNPSGFSHTLSNLPTKINLPTEVISSINKLLNQLSTSQQISNPNSIKQVLQQSGQFLENNLLNANQQVTPSLSHDYKASLFNILRTINTHINQLPPSSQKSTSNQTTTMPTRSEETPSQLHQQGNKQLRNHQQVMHHHRHDSLPLKGAIPQPLKAETPLPLPWENASQLLTQLKQEVHHALSRIQANQLQSIQSDPLVTIMLDLPVKGDKGIDVIPMMIEEKDEIVKRGENKKIWSVMLALNIESLGEMQVKISLKDEKIHVNFWSPNQNTLQTLVNNQKNLSQELESLGLSLSQFNTYLGLKENEIIKPQSQLLDIKI